MTNKEQELKKQIEEREVQRLESEMDRLIDKLMAEEVLEVRNMLSNRLRASNVRYLGLTGRDYVLQKYREALKELDEKFSHRRKRRFWFC